jgi:hypothetical protein
MPSITTSSRQGIKPLSVSSYLVHSLFILSALALRCHVGWAKSVGSGREYRSFHLPRDVQGKSVPALRTRWKAIFSPKRAHASGIQNKTWDSAVLFHLQRLATVGNPRAILPPCQPPATSPPSLSYLTLKRHRRLDVCDRHSKHPFFPFYPGLPLAFIIAHAKDQSQCSVSQMSSSRESRLPITSLKATTCRA